MPELKSISHEIERYTASISDFDTSRNYVSLSHVGMEEDEIIRTYLDGFEDTLRIRLKCYKGYQMERDLVQRIVQAFPGRAQVPFPEISREWSDISIKGHPDLMFDGYPADVKSVPLDEHLPQNGKLPRKVYWQMQGYMRYAELPKALVIYESRETGAIRDYWIRENRSIQDQIHTKLCYVTSEISMALIRKLERERGINA